MKIEKGTIFKTLGNFAVLVLLLAAGVNLYAKLFYFLLAAIFVAAITHKLRLDGVTVVYVLLAVLMAVYNVESGIKAMVRPVTYAGLYVVGLSLTRVTAPKSDPYMLPVEKGEKSANNLLAVVALGTFVHFMLNFVYNFGADIGRNTLDFWTGEKASATLQASLACLMLGFSVAGVFFAKKGLNKIICAICLVCIMAYNLVLAGRTIIVIFAVIALICFVVWLFTYKNARAKARAIGVVLGVVAGGLALVLFNVGGIKDAIEASNLYDRFVNVSIEEILDTGRMGFKLKYIQLALEYPFGGGKIYEIVGRYAHDIFLDAYSEYGIFAFLMIVIVIIWGTKELVKMLKSKNVGLFTKMAFLCVSIVLMLEFAVEPILAGMQWLFSIYCLVNGCIKGINLNVAKQKKLNTPQKALYLKRNTD